jgi:glycine/D-amino acid oxidase-like deaminating enzyme/nitrite reductase/ring-hydroxylating ferredoxin subunit
MAETGGSYWVESAQMPRYPVLDRDIDVDVVVVGAGITGLTAAYLLKRSGRCVAVIERARVGGVDSMYTTAHLTAVTDLDLTDLVSAFGRDHAQAAWDAGFAAIQQLDATVRDENISCEWTWVPGYRYQAHDSRSDRDRKRLREEAVLAEELEFDAMYLDEVPGLGHAGVAYAGQAKFHPGKYLAHLARIVDGDGCFVFEQTSCEDVTDNPLTVKAGTFSLRCGHVVLATHTPLIGKANIASATLLQTKLYLYTSYVVGGRLPKGTVPEGLFWDTADPYRYVRVDRHADHDFVIVGGEDHKTGQVTDTEQCYRRLVSTARTLFPRLEVTNRWSGQVIQTNDGLPFIGETAERQFTATGFSGNGMTFGTLGAMMARDHILGLKNPWRALFDVGRTKIKGGVWDYLKENVDYPYYMVRDRFAGAQGKSLRELRQGEGKLISLEGKTVAAFRRSDGSAVVLSPVCTHMGCVVAWNQAESTWDCPCHGSRFTAEGDVMAGPAESPLDPFEPSGRVQEREVAQPRER